MLRRAFGRLRTTLTAPLRRSLKLEEQRKLWRPVLAHYVPFRLAIVPRDLPPPLSQVEQIRRAIHLPIPTSLPPLNHFRLHEEVLGSWKSGHLPAQYGASKYHAAYHHQRLEWVGDRVLNNVAGQLVFVLAPVLQLSSPSADPDLGWLESTNRRLCSNAFGADLGRSFRLDRNLDLRTKSKENADKDVADRFEAFIGALWLELGQEAVLEFLAPLFHREILWLHPQLDSLPPLLPSSTSDAALYTSSRSPLLIASSSKGVPSTQLVAPPPPPPLTYTSTAAAASDLLGPLAKHVVTKGNTSILSLPGWPSLQVTKQKGQTMLKTLLLACIKHGLIVIQTTATSTTPPSDPPTTSKEKSTSSTTATSTTPPSVPPTIPKEKPTLSATPTILPPTLPAPSSKPSTASLSTPPSSPLSPPPPVPQPKSPPSTPAPKPPASKKPQKPSPLSTDSIPLPFITPSMIWLPHLPMLVEEPKLTLSSRLSARAAKRTKELIAPAVAQGEVVLGSKGSGASPAGHLVPDEPTSSTSILPSSPPSHEAILPPLAPDSSNIDSPTTTPTSSLAHSALPPPSQLSSPALASPPSAEVVETAAQLHQRARRATVKAHLPLRFTSLDAGAEGLVALLAEKGLAHHFKVFEGHGRLALSLSLPGYFHPVVRCSDLERAAGMRELLVLLVDRGVVVLGSEAVESLESPAPETSTSLKSFTPDESGSSVPTHPIPCDEAILSAPTNSTLPPESSSSSAGSSPSPSPSPPPPPSRWTSSSAPPSSPPTTTPQSTASLPSTLSTPPPSSTPKVSPSSSAKSLPLPSKAATETVAQRRQRLREAAQVHLPLRFSDLDTAANEFETTLEAKGLSQHLKVREDSHKTWFCFPLGLPGSVPHTVRCASLDREKGIRETIEVAVERGLVVLGDDEAAGTANALVHSSSANPLAVLEESTSSIPTTFSPPPSGEAILSMLTTSTLAPESSYSSDVSSPSPSISPPPPPPPPPPPSCSTLSPSPPSSSSPTSLPTLSTTSTPEPSPPSPAKSLPLPTEAATETASQRHLPLRFSNLDTAVDEFKAKGLSHHLAILKENGRRYVSFPTGLPGEVPYNVRFSLLHRQKSLRTVVEVGVGRGLIVLGDEAATESSGLGSVEGSPPPPPSDETILSALTTSPPPPSPPLSTPVPTTFEPTATEPTAPAFDDAAILQALTTSFVETELDTRVDSSDDYGVVEELEKEGARREERK